MGRNPRLYDSWGECGEWRTEDTSTCLRGLPYTHERRVLLFSLSRVGVVSPFRGLLEEVETEVSVCEKVVSTRNVVVKDFLQKCIITSSGKSFQSTLKDDTHSVPCSWHDARTERTKGWSQVVSRVTDERKITQRHTHGTFIRESLYPV